MYCQYLFFLILFNVDFSNAVTFKHIQESSKSRPTSALPCWQTSLKVTHPKMMYTIVHVTRHRLSRESHKLKGHYTLIFMCSIERYGLHYLTNSYSWWHLLCKWNCTELTMYQQINSMCQHDYATNDMAVTTHLINYVAPN